MPQRVWDLVDARLLVVRDVVNHGMSVREAAARHRVGKSAVAQWVARYREFGAEGLAPRSRRPTSSPGQTPALVEDAIVRLHKERLGRWGAKKVRAALLDQGWDVPAVSTVQTVLARRGLLGPRPARKTPRDPGVQFQRSACNELWQIDGTQHHLVNGRTFWVVDLIDDHSRFLTGALVGASMTGELAWASLRKAVCECGLPAELLSDNGTQFTGRLLQGGVTVRFERQATAAGITLRHGRPYHPQTQGKIERQHATQNAWIADHRPRSLAHAQDVIDSYRADYNTVRPHEAIGLVPPVRRYVPGSGVELPALELEPADAYPPGALLRRVDPQSRIRYSSTTFVLDSRWVGVTVGILHHGPTLRVFYGHAEIATIPVGNLTVTTVTRKTKRS